MSIDYMIARAMTAKSPGPRPKEPAGGKPELSAADISLIASAAPRINFHALMAKICDDRISEREILNWTNRKSLSEWFTNPDYEKVRFETRQLKRIAELAVLAWLNPQCHHAAYIGTRAAFVGCSSDKFKRCFQAHYAYLVGELGYIEAVGRKAVYQFLRGDT